MELSRKFLQEIENEQHVEMLNSILQKSSVYFLGPHRTARVLWNRLQIYAPRLRCSPASVRAQAWAKRRMDGWRALGYPIGVEDQMKEISIQIIKAILWTYKIVR